MINLNKILLLFALQYSTTLAFPLCEIVWFYPWDNATESCIIENPACPEGQSLISRNDITLMIDHIAKHTIKIKESLVEGYYQKAVDVNSKHIEELNEFQEKIEEQPKLLKHILKKMEDERISFEPTVKQIAAEIEEGDAYEEKILSASNRLNKVLTMMNAYEAICQINTEDLKLVRSLKHRQNSPLNEPVPPSPICGSLKEFHNEIIKQLTDFRDEYIGELLIFIEDRDNNYSASVASHNKKLKDIAMRQYKGVMYDILKLQDDFIHFEEHLNESNITHTLNDTKNHLERVEQLLNGLEKDVHKYGQRCMENNHKRDRGDLDATSSTRSPELLEEIKMKHGYNHLKIIDKLTQFKIEEIKNEVLRNITDTFKALDEHLNNFTINSTNSVNNTPNSEDMADIKKAQKALIELKSIIPQSSFDKLQKLRHNSQEILAETEKAKDNLDLKLKGNYLLA